VKAATVNHLLTIFHGFALISQQLRRSSRRYRSVGTARWKAHASRRTMLTRSSKFGFALPALRADAPQDTLPALIATLSLGVSIAVVLTATLSAARAAQLF
jgi:hypothetical protein